ncbi:alpha/beta fold hydrolase [Streptomyces sp. NPDC007172]|uniref:alpha/beta fold hydrolase n=1 Tax=Streptomyces sp. NPDC007172 TaxID=3364776 RepID=UPI00368DB91C
MAYTTANGIRLFHTDTGTGTGTGTPVLFLHGWGSGSHVWEPQTAELAADHRVLAVDLRGCGRTDHPAAGNTTDANVADILALLDALGLERPLLVGSSLGATFALEAALRAPHRVAGVVSISGPGYWPAQAMSETLRTLRTALRDDRAATLSGWVPQWFGPEADPGLAARTVEQILRSGPHVIDLLNASETGDPRETLAQLAVPALFLHGRLDTEIPPEVSRTLARLAPYGEFHEIARAGHMPHQEQPAAVNALIRTALARAAADAPLPA